MLITLLREIYSKAADGRASGACGVNRVFLTLIYTSKLVRFSSRFPLPFRVNRPGLRLYVGRKMNSNRSSLRCISAKTKFTKIIVKLAVRVERGMRM